MVNLIDFLRCTPQKDDVVAQFLRLHRQKETILYGAARTTTKMLPVG